ncbi:MAG TPA: Ig-like domain-containing protein, partial [Enhygromyxa sp.]|nr:Ig-like domain-containing protein [Enhygromyxa sp.]
IELPFPPPVSESPSTTEAPTGPLEVLRFGPDGEQTLVEAIRVSFNHSMVPLASIEDLRQQPAPMKIEPAVPGEFRWMGTRTVAFYPTGRLPYSTTYEVTIPAGTKSVHGTELEKDVSWTVRTPRLALERSVPSGDWDIHVRLDQPVLLRFNQAIDAKKVADAITLSGGGKQVAFELIPADRWKEPDLAPWIDQWVTGGEQEWERSRVLVLRPKQKLEPDTRYTVKLPAGVYGEGPERSDAISFSFSTYPPLRLSQHKCDPSPCSASYGLMIDATNQIRDARVIDKVHVTPEVEDLEIHEGWNGISMTGKFVGETTYEVTVDAGLQDVYGQQLAKPFTTKIKLGPLDPDLQVWPRQQNPGIIEAKAGHTIKLQVAGLRELEIIGTSFNSAELPEYHTARYHYEDEWPAAMGTPVATKKLDVSESRKRSQIIELDVDEFVDGTDTFVYLFVRSEKYKIWDWEDRRRLTQVVQLTNLGVTAAFDRDDAVVLVTDLATGEPVADAEVKLLSDNATREVWKGRSNQDGIARPEIGNSRAYSSLIVARKGDDEVFMPVDQADLEGRWISGLLGYPYEEDVRAFIFTERQPYKPGEKVHLVGVLRRETKGPNGRVELWGAGAEGKYTVTSPRGVKVQEGTVKIGPFGTFAVDIETDENGDTGTYSFELTHNPLFGSSRSFWHGFAVEEFRTPEFEVEVARNDSKPLYFGDELEVEIRGRYLYGAPMIGAQASYTLTRQATDFRPPAEGLSGFHFSASPGHRWGMYGYWGGNWSPVENIEGKTLALDRKGILKVTHALAQVEPKKVVPGIEPPPPSTEPEKEPLPQAATFSIAATVVDENRQAIAGSGSFVVHPAAYYVGLRSERSVLKENERTRVEAVVVDVDGKRITGVDVSLKAIRKETTRKAVQKDGVWGFDYETKEIETSSCELRSDSSPVACEVVVGKAGTHDVVATLRDAEGRENRSTIQIFVHGKDAVVWDEDQKRVDLVPDKEDYQPGDKAKILVRSPFDEARGFLVIEREGRAQTHDLHVQGGVASTAPPRRSRSGSSRA